MKKYKVREREKKEREEKGDEYLLIENMQGRYALHAYDYKDYEKKEECEGKMRGEKNERKGERGEKWKRGRV